MMWLIHADGMCSTVQFDNTKDPAMAERFGATDPEGDYLLVRGRDRQQMQLIAGRFDLTLEDDTAADYKYRLVLTRDQFKIWTCEQIDGIVYKAHFKEYSMSRPVNKGFKKWQTALYSIWYELELLQDTAAYLTRVWKRDDLDWTQTSKHSAVESAETFAGIFGWDEILESPQIERLELEGSADGYRFTDRMTDDLDDPFLWDEQFADLTDAEIMELEDLDDWHRANDQIVRELRDEQLAKELCASDAVAGTVDASPRKQRRRNRRLRNTAKKGK